MGNTDGQKIHSKRVEKIIKLHSFRVYFSKGHIDMLRFLANVSTLLVLILVLYAYGFVSFVKVADEGWWVKKYNDEFDDFKGY